jgi:hypothetical protein
MSDDRGPAGQAPEELGDIPSVEAVASRADGRPPEEASSDDPTAQAQAILEDSEERIAEGAKDSEPTNE